MIPSKTYQLALSVAVGRLSEQEPADSRAVSDVFVALACVLSGDDGAMVRSVLEAEQQQQTAKGLRIAYCYDHSINPFENAADGGHEAWQLVTDAELAEDFLKV